MTEEQKLAIKCAHADLVGAKEAKQDTSRHDWKGHEKTIEDLEKVFPEIILDGE